MQAIVYAWEQRITEISSYFSKLETSVFAVDLDYWRSQSVNRLSLETIDTRNLNILTDFLIKCKCDVAD